MKVDDTKYYGKSTQAMIKNNVKPYAWDKEPNPILFTPFKKYDQEPSLKESVKHCEKISDFFNFFLNDEIIDIVVNSTNFKLAMYSMDKKCLYRTNLEPVSPIEIRGYFGLLVLFGVLKKHDVAISELWSEDGVDNVQNCYYATATMSRDRFLVISCNISFDEIETREERKAMDTKFYKMRNVFDIWTKNLRDSYSPGYYLCVDETL